MENGEKNRMANLSRDEETVLLIAAKGERMMPIGRWKAPVETLTAKGLLTTQPNPGDPTGNFNCVITAAGREAVEQLDTAFDTVPAIQQTVGAIAHEHAKLRAEAEHIAVKLAALVGNSVKVTGEPAQESAENWVRVIVKRALELM